MRIVNQAVSEDIAAGRGLRLNLGCGTKARPGFYGVDCLPLAGVDVVADLNAPLSLLPDDSVEEIYSRHTLEHVSHFMELMAELHRVTRPGGRIEIIVPHFSNPYGYSDPTHVRFFGAYSFFYFCDQADQPRRKVPAFYVTERFQVDSVRCRLLRHSLAERLARFLLERVINLNIGWLDWYERRLCRLLPAEDVRFVLRPKKSAIGCARRAA